MSRLGKMGDQAEAVFEEVYPQKWARFGLSRPPINLAKVPGFIRYTPDYITAKGLVEVQGFGKDQTAKFKTSKLDALRLWAEVFRVDFFLWDSHLQRFGWVRLPELDVALAEHGARLSFHEGNPYFAIPAGRLPVVSGWTAYGGMLEVER